MRASHRTILLVALALPSCERSRTSGSIPPSEGILAPRALAALPLQIVLPSDATVHATASGVSIVMHPRLRASLGINIVRADTQGSFLGTNAKTRALTPTLQLTYHEQVLPAEGSGGEDHVLDGLLTLAGKTYRITCSQKSELDSAAQACLPFLATLRSTPHDQP